MPFDYTVRNNAYQIRNNSYVAYQLVDSIEDGDIAEYQDNNNVFAALQDSTLATDGDWVLEFNTGSGGNSACASLTGLDNYPSRGDNILANIQVAAVENGGGIQFALQDDQNTFPQGYRVAINYQNNSDLEIVHQDPPGTFGGTYDVARTPIDMSGLANEPLELEVEFRSPTLTARAYDSGGGFLGETGDDDSDFDSGGFGWVGSIDTTLGEDQYVHQDFARVI